MTAARAPWWMYVVAASFVGFFVFTVYADAIAPESAGAGEIAFGAGDLHLIRVTPGGAFDRAGIRNDDRIVAVDGDRIVRFSDWQRHRLGFRAGVPIALDVLRQDTGLHVRLTLHRAGISNSLGLGRANYFVWRSCLLALIVICGFVFFRPDDVVAQLGALLLARFAAGSPMLGPVYGWRAAWATLPMPIAALFLIPAAAVALSPAMTFALFSLFPRPYFGSRRVLLALCAPPALLAPFVFHRFWAMYDAPMGIVWDQRLMTAWFVLLLGYSVVSYIVLALNYRRLRDVNERRRVRAVVPSIVVTWILSFHLIVVTNWAALFPTPAPPFFSVAMVSIDSVLLIIPALLFAYAIVRHRVFNLSVVIRRGLQYALARRMVVSLLPATMALLLVDAAVHRDQTFGEIASRRGWLYAGVGSVALVGRRRQQQWLDALDRQFFRERYHAEQILRAVAEEIRHAASIEQAAGRVAARIEAAVHPEFVAVLVRAPNEVAYHALAVSPPDMPPPILHAETKLVGLLRLLDKPLQLGTADSDWLARQLPRDETVFLQRSRVDLLIPISLPPFGREALLVLGQKKSEEPYGTDDQELLLAIANGLAVLLERPLTGTVAAKGDEQPRVLGGRYRLDHLLGRGGMGAVYSALDMTLERHVAIKLVRDDLLTSAEAADRFRREAKAAAALAHPNIVTLHDFAVDADRAFLVMELLRGTTLRHELRRGRMLSTSRMFEVVRGLCAALTYAHGRGIVHRDLKPENVFLISDGTEVIPKILDFGLAKVIVSSEAVTQATIGTGIGVFVGTPKYMSPEQMRGLPVSPQWDVWAVSVMIYEMLIGAYPFGNVESFAALQERIIDGRFTPVNQVSTDAPESWQKFFVALLNAESSRRPATAMQLLTECELLKSDL